MLSVFFMVVFALGVEEGMGGDVDMAGLLVLSADGETMVGELMVCCCS